MSTVDPTKAPQKQVQAVQDAIRQDTTIPIQHKTILQSILSFILHIAPSIFELFVGSDGAVDTTAAEVLEAADPNTVHPAVSPVAKSLAKAVTTVKGQAGANSSVLDKIFAFVLKILPTVLGLFSHSPVSASSAGSTPVGGASAGSQPGAALGGGGGDTPSADQVGAGAGSAANGQGAGAN